MPLDLSALIDPSFERRLSIAVLARATSHEAFGLASGAFMPIDARTGDQSPAALCQVSPGVGHPWYLLVSVRDGEGRGVRPRVILAPDQADIVIVDCAAAIAVGVEPPHAVRDLALGGVRGVVIDTANEILAVFDDANLCCFHRSGQWVARDLVFAELSIVELGPSSLVARGYDAPSRRAVTFAIDLLSGDAPDAPYRRFRASASGPFSPAYRRSLVASVEKGELSVAEAARTAGVGEPIIELWLSDDAG